jgi:hypothetical protein
MRRQVSLKGLMLLGAVSSEPFLTWTQVEVCCAVALLVEALLLVGLRPGNRAAARRREARGAVSLGLVSLVLAIAGAAMYWHYSLDPRKAHFALVYHVLDGLLTLLGWGIGALTALSLFVGTIVVLAPSFLGLPQATVTPGAAEGAATPSEAPQEAPAGRTTARRRLSPWLEVFGVLYAASLATSVLVLIRRIQEAGISGSALFRLLDLGLPLGLMLLFGVLTVIFVWDIAERSRRQGVAFVLLAILIAVLDLAYDVHWLLIH